MLSSSRFLSHKAGSFSAPKQIQKVFYATGGQEVKKTRLYNFHVENKGVMAPFAGWNMPLYYKDKPITAVHKHCREHAALFDVSHMGQLTLTGKDRIEFIESLVPGDITSLAEDHSRLTQLTNEKGGILDDTIITKKKDYLYMIINAGCTDQDLEHLRKHLKVWQAKGKDVQLNFIETHSLVALQGPDAPKVLQRYIKDYDLNEIAFMTTRDLKIEGVPCRVTRCGYTGEDGFEISVPHDYVEAFAKSLTKQPEVVLAGLAPRDSLRLEAGLCLMGHDMNPDITPIEAGLLFTISKRRQEQGGFPGAAVIQKQIKEGVKKTRVGFILDSKSIARENMDIYSNDQKVGIVTSGALSPCLDKPIGMGYVPIELSKPGTPIVVDIRGKKVSGEIAKMPVVPQKYYRKPKASTK